MLATRNTVKQYGYWYTGPWLHLDDQVQHQQAWAGRHQGIFQDLEHGGVNQPLGVPSLPFSSSLPFPSRPFPSLSPFPLKLGVLCESWEGVLPLPKDYVFSSVWSLVSLSVCQDYSNEHFFDIFVAVAVSS